jgi:hypothetical protein
LPALLVLGVLAAARTASAACDDPFADPDDILDLHVRVSTAEWDTLRLADPVGEGCDAQYPFVEAEYRCGDDEPWLTIGTRRKRGDQRGRDTDHKPPLKLDFNRVVQGQRWPAARGELGWKKLSLNNGMTDNPGGADTALLSEHFAWRLMRREVPTASGVAYARLWVHLDDGAGETVTYHGLYILIEDIDRTAIKARFGDATGTLYKTTTGDCRNEVEFDDGDPNQADDLVDTWFGLDPGAEYEGGWLAETERHLHLEDLLRQEAIRDVLGNRRDTPLGPHDSNFYAFDPRAGRRWVLPWDLDDMFGPIPQEVDVAYPLEPECSAAGERTRCHPDIRPRYLEIMCQLINGTLAADRLVAEWDAIDARIRPDIAAEVDTVWFESEKGPMDDQEGTYVTEVPRLRAWIQARIPFVRARIEAEGVSCPTGCQDGDTVPCEILTCAGTRTCVDGGWSTCEPDPAEELCDNDVDDDCDGVADEGCGGPGDPVDPAGNEPTSGGCGCVIGARPGPVAGGALLLLALVLLRRRRR